MRLWDWTKGIVRDQTGGVEPVNVGLERNPGAVVELGAENPPDVPIYVLRVGIRGGFGGTRAGLPVFRHENASPHPILKEIYRCEVAGKSLEAANVYALRSKVERQLEVIAPARALPLCYFRAPRFDYSLPVYEQGARLVCPVLTGPKIKSHDLAGLREPLVRWLRSAGYLMEDEQPEILVVRPSDIRLVPPAAVIRSLDDASLWLPAVEGASEGGRVIGLLSNPTELREHERRRRGPTAPDAPPSAPDVTGLLRYIGHELAVRGHVLNPWALYATDVRPEIWARAEELTDATGQRLACLMEGGESLGVPVRHTAAGEVVAGLQERGITVFLAGDTDALATSVARYLVEIGFLRHAGDMRIETAAERPAESLDLDTIWTQDQHARGASFPRGHRNHDTELETEDREVTQT
ncbi:MAG: hypothetical protein ACRDL3_05880 [Solirubrobacterales bacterium]